MSDTIPSAAAVRLNYHDGMFLTSSLMTQEQSYFVNWFTLQNRYLYTPGVLNGLKASGQNKTVTVEGGVGFDVDGNFLVFPGSSNNTLSVGSAGFSPFGVYLRYAYVATPGADTVDTAAVLAIGDASGGTINGVILALVTLDQDGNISSVTDRRAPVTSRLPADLAGGGGGQPVDFNASKQGTASFARMTLSKPGDTSQQTVSYDAPTVQAFARPPQVFVSVQGAVPFSAEVTAVSTFGFSLTLGALVASTGDDPILVDWLALVAA
jgi:hypothetical protein